MFTTACSRLLLKAPSLARIASGTAPAVHGAASRNALAPVMTCTASAPLPWLKRASSIHADTANAWPGRIEIAEGPVDVVSGPLGDECGACRLRAAYLSALKLRGYVVDSNVGQSSKNSCPSSIV